MSRQTLRREICVNRRKGRPILLRLLISCAFAACLLVTLTGVLPVGAQESAHPTQTQNTPPTAAFTIDPSQGVVGTTFFFDPISSSDNEDSDAWLLVRFDFEDDGTWDTTWLNPTNSPERHTYDQVQTYTVRLEVKDQGDLTDTTTLTAVVDDPGSNTNPTAVCNVTPTIGPPGTTFTLTASNSTDAQDAIGDIEVKWDQFGSFDFRNQSWQPATQPVTFSYTTLGLHDIDLLVMDSGYLMDSAECQIEIEPVGGNTAPTAELVISPTQGTTDDSFSFNVQGSLDGEDAIASLSVRFDWTDDGIYDTGWLNASQLWTNRFADVWGAITVRAQVRDSGGLTDEVTQVVSVTRISRIHFPLLSQ